MSITHPELVTVLAKPGQAIVDSLTAENAHILHMAIGISGESGELLDAIKKHVFYNKPLDIANVIEELGDLEFYMEGLRQGTGISREEVLEHNIAKLSIRYGKTYSDEAAQTRADKA
jgi:NTP pyrophosphatase (non-canonical NTP hydrolase)